MHCASVHFSPRIFDLERYESVASPSGGVRGEVFKGYSYPLHLCSVLLPFLSYPLVLSLPLNVDLIPGLRRGVALIHSTVLPVRPAPGRLLPSPKSPLFLHFQHYMVSSSRHYHASKPNLGAQYYRSGFRTYQAKKYFVNASPPVSVVALIDVKISPK